MHIPVTVSKSGPGLAKLKADLQRIEKSDVLIGIPSSGSSRKGETVNNAELLWIFSKGSELNHQPPRPVLEPSIELNKDKITPHLAKAAQGILENDPGKATAELNRAGIIASNGAKRYFTQPENNWAPNAPSTIAAKGSDRPGIDIGLMRRAITWVLREDGRESLPLRGSEAPAIEPGTNAPLAAGESVGAEVEAGIGEAAETIGGGLLP